MRLATVALAATLGLTFAGWAFLALSLAAPVPSAWGFRGFPGLFAIAFGWIGYLVATRQPRNPIGWAFLCAAAISAVQVAATEYASYALFVPGTGLGGGPVGAWLNDWIWLSLVGLVTVPVFLYFPDGRLTDARWRFVLWIEAIAVAVASILLAITPGPMQTFGVENPFGVSIALTAADAGVVGGRTAGPIVIISLTIFGACALAAATSTALRFQRSHGLARQQLKWFAASATLVAIALVASFAVVEKWVQILLISALTTVPLAIGIAILRYRLYEIDALINRAIVYGALTAVLAGVYSASIGLFQKLFLAMTGEKSDAAIVITTLILASVFTPMKSWLQTATDRRFKAPTDARKRLESFREGLRLVSEAVDGGALRRRFLEEATSALHARGARLVLGRGAGRREEQCGEWSTAVTACDLIDDGATVGRIELGPRRDGAPYTKVDLAELDKTAAVVARAYVLAERLALTRTPGG